MIRTTLAVTTILCVASLAPAAAPAPSESAAPARQLTALLDARDLDAVAAADPQEPGRFIAALYYPATQLLVVSARYPVPIYMEQRLQRRQYRDAYIELQTAGDRAGRLFIEDMKADGLDPSPAADEPFDITYQSGSMRIAYAGSWTDQGLSEGAYKARFAADDARYAQMLAALVNALKTAILSNP